MEVKFQINFKSITCNVGLNNLLSRSKKQCQIYTEPVVWTSHLYKGKEVINFLEIGTLRETKVIATWAFGVLGRQVALSFISQGHLYPKCQTNNESRSEGEDFLGLGWCQSHHQSWNGNSSDRWSC